MISALGGTVRSYRQVMFWFQPDGPSEWFRADRMPVYIRLPDAQHDMFYGFPSLANSSGELKIAGEQFDRACEPDALNRLVSDSEKQAMYHAAASSLRITPRCVRAVACQYTVTLDFNFVIDHYPESDRVWFASACSGHGFKHSAAVGETLAELATHGNTRFDLSSFTLDRLGQS